MSIIRPVDIWFVEQVLPFERDLLRTAERLCHDIILINKSRKVIGGSLREVKESYGTNLIAFRGTNADKVISDKTLVERVVSHADEQELHLAEGVDPQQVLKTLLDAGATIAKFEMTEPSLNDIFIEKVTNA